MGVTWEVVGRVGLSGLLLVAAIGKARSLDAFVRYLRRPFGRLAPIIGVVAIGAEVLLAISLLVIGDAVITRLAVAGFLLLASAVYAVRLISDDATRCNCWGATPLGREESAIARIVRPAWIGLRNGAILALAWAAGNGPGIGSSHLRPADVLVLLAAPCGVVCAGLVASVAVRRRHLKLARHPLRAVLAPRLSNLVALSWYSDGSPRHL